MRKKINQAKANKIYDILVQDGGANPSNRDSFVRYVTEGDDAEWRFCGNLGFGGKFYHNCGRIWVSCYSEERTIKNQTTIQLINSKLEAL